MAVTVLMTSTASAQTRSIGADLPVRLYDLSGQSDDQRRIALETATAALASAGVRILWTLCAPADRSDAGCNAPPRDSERIVRVLQTSPAWSRREGVSMGDSVIDCGSQSGGFATVYADRVSWMAARAAITPAVLLGLAIGHELGHLLLGSGHTSAGIMRRSWPLNELRWNRPGDWQFTREQIAVLGLAEAGSRNDNANSASAGPGRPASRRRACGWRTYDVAPASGVAADYFRARCSSLWSHKPNLEVSVASANCP